MWVEVARGALSLEVAFKLRSAQEECGSHINIQGNSIPSRRIVMQWPWDGSKLDMFQGQNEGTDMCLQ